MPWGEHTTIWAAVSCWFNRCRNTSIVTALNSPVCEIYRDLLAEMEYRIYNYVVIV